MKAKALIAVSVLAALLAGASVSNAAPADGCRTKSLHGIWDCR